MEMIRMGFFRFLSYFICDSAARRHFRLMHCSHRRRLYDRVHRRHPMLGEGTSGYDNLLIPDRRTTVGKYCSIGRGVSIGTGMHPLNFLSTHAMQYVELPYAVHVPKENLGSYVPYHPCHIGNDVWIGMNAIVMDGVTIGDGAVVGAGAIVTKDVPPYAIVVGIPAKILKYRFDEKTIAELLELKWYDLPREQIAQLPFSDVPKCIEKLKELRGKK